MPWTQTINVEPQQDKWPSPTQDEIFWTSGPYMIRYFHRHLDNYGNPGYVAYRDSMRVHRDKTFCHTLEEAIGECKNEDS